MSENLKTFNEQDFGSMAPEVFSAVRFLETISCQLADATQFLEDISSMRKGKFSQSEEFAMTLVVKLFGRRCEQLLETLDKIEFLKNG